MSDKVISISDFQTKKPEWVFECPCGSQIFFLLYDGMIECRSCKQVKERIEWTFRKGEAPE
jgi:hypothetical protein